MIEKKADAWRSINDDDKETENNVVEHSQTQ